MKNIFQKPLNFQEEKTILKKVIKFFSAKFVFTPPPKKKILIFDNNGLKMLLSFFKKNEVDIYYRRFEKVNIYILLFSLFDFRQKFNLSRRYQYNYIKYVNPKMIITFTDNLENFYKLKNYFKGIKTICIQNGLRNFDIMKRDQISKKNFGNKEFKVDYLFTLNESYKDYYTKYIDGEVKSLGSLRNNFIKIKRKKNFSINKKKKSLLFISQFNYFKYVKEFEKKNYLKINSKWYSYKNFKEAEINLIPILINYCKKKKILLKILGKTSSEEEYTFFKNLFKDKTFKWKYYPKKNQLYGEPNKHAYQLIDKVDAVVFIDSALGYEALSRETPTACFSIRGRFLEKIKCFDFGFPHKTKSNGPFWTNEISKVRIYQVLDFIFKTNPRQWSLVKKKYAKKITFFSNQNANLKKILKFNI